MPSWPQPPRARSNSAAVEPAGSVVRVSLRYETISFLSDFGHADEFVGVVHSVIRSIAPAVTVVDVTHVITHHDVRAGGLALARAAN